MPVFWLLAVACLIELPLGQTTIFGEDVILWDTLFRAVAASPVLIHFYREDAVFRGKERWGWKEAALWAAAGFGLSLLATLAVQVLSRAGLQADMSMVEENLLSGPLWLELTVLLAASPFLEEIFFRGILFQRLQWFRPWYSACTMGPSPRGSMDFSWDWRWPGPWKGPRR